MLEGMLNRFLKVNALEQTWQLVVNEIITKWFHFACRFIKIPMYIYHLNFL